MNLGWARGRLHDAAAGAEDLRRALAVSADHGGGGIGDAWFYNVLLAELEAETLGADVALAQIDEALALADRVEYRCDLAFPHRLRGEILLKRDPSNPAPAEEAFRTALAIAKQQGARSWSLRAALSLAKLYQSTGRPADAHAVLAPALEGFAPTPEMPEIAEAQALLAALAETDEVRADAEQRRRMTRLRVAYGNALFTARGFGAPETMDAFAKARESASGRHGPVRSTGRRLWSVGRQLRSGDLSSMRAHVEAFLGDVRARPDSPEAGIAYRVCGVTHQFAGEYGEARDNLERALALFQPGRDDDLAFRFGMDVGAAVLLCSAIALWPLGEVERAMSLAESARARLAAITHTGTLAFGRHHSALFHLMRGDRVRVAQDAVELARLAREHDLTQFRAFAVFFEGWATAADGAPGGGLEDMRRGVDLLREQNLLFFDGLLKIALAEAEARAGDPDRAVAILDEALATADRLGYRAFEAELHRARGEMLLMRDPADPAPAEEAFKTRDRRCAAARNPQLRPARGACARQTLPVDRPPRRRPRRPRARARRLSADAGNAGDRRGGGVARVPGGDGGGQGRGARRSGDAFARRLRQRAHRGARVRRPETTEAFARARELAHGDKNAPERLAADYGLWASSYVRGRLAVDASPREAFLGDVGRDPTRPKPASPIAPPG